MDRFFIERTDNGITNHGTNSVFLYDTTRRAIGVTLFLHEADVPALSEGFNVSVL